MSGILYRICQCTWGIFQTLLGLALYLMCGKCDHFDYHGSIVTVWKMRSSVSLGMFVFVTSDPFFAPKFDGRFSAEELSGRPLVHEYGHTIQSLILGPLYLFVIGIPSMLWGFLGGKRRREEQIPYGAFFTESWANHLGERITGEMSIGNLVLE